MWIWGQSFFKSGVPLHFPTDGQTGMPTDEPITPTREVKVAKLNSDTEPVARIEIGPETANRQKSHIPESTILAERWEILEFLGEGGMSSVYKTKHIAMGRMAAAKVLHPHLSFDDKHLQRFQREAQAASAVNHQNVISIYDCGITPDGRPFILMEYLPGKSLAEELRANGKFPLDRALKIFLAICDGMAHAHEKGVVHRDLKPSNVMLVPGDDGRELAKVVDFGIARLIPNEGAEGEALHQLTQTGEVFGSPLYMSPEQCLGKHPDQRSDIYALGCLMYEVLAGYPPLKGNSFLETMHMQMEEQPKPFAKAGVSDAKTKLVEGVILKCLAKDPVDRYGTMHELKRDLLFASGDGAIFGFWRTRASRDFFKRFGKQKKKEFALLRFSTLLVLVCVPLSLGVLHVLYTNWKFDEIPSGINSTHQIYWSKNFAQSKTPPPHRDLKLNTKLLAAKAALPDFLNNPDMGVQQYSMALNEAAQVELDEGRYADALKHFTTLISARQQVFGKQDPIRWGAILGRAQCLFFLGNYNEAENAFRSAMILADKVAMESTKEQFLQSLGIYSEMLLKSPNPDFRKVAEICKLACDLALSKEFRAKDTPQDLELYFYFANLRGDALKLSGNPDDAIEKNFVAELNQLQSEGEGLSATELGKLRRENPRFRGLRTLRKLSPALAPAKACYSDMLSNMNAPENVEKVTNFHRLMYYWGKGTLEQKFGMDNASGDLSSALSQVKLSKLEKSAEIEAQIEKDLALLLEKTNPWESWRHKLLAVETWRSRK